MLLARGPRYRLPAEAIRDNALFASGLLITKVGGDSVFPYQPARVWDNSSPFINIYPDSVPEDEYHRRTMYTYFKRNAPHPALMVFDMADRNVSTVSRRISSTPLQALVLLNDPQYMEAYRKMAERAIRMSPEADAQVIALFRLATRRRPLDSEQAILTKYREAQLEHMSRSKADVKKLMSIGVAPADPTLDPDAGRGTHDGRGRRHELTRRVHVAVMRGKRRDDEHSSSIWRSPPHESIVGADAPLLSCRAEWGSGSWRPAVCSAARRSGRAPRPCRRHAGRTRAC